MAGDVANPRIWANADVYVAPVGTAGPTDTSTALNVAFEAVGLLSEDGMTESREDETADHYAWGGILVRTTRSKHKRTFTVTVLEDNPTVWELVNPGSTAVTATGTTTRTVKVPGTDPRAWVLHFIDGDVVKRRHIPRAEVIEVGDVSFSDSEMVMFELTVSVYPDGDGVLYKDITDDPQAVVV